MCLLLVLLCRIHSVIAKLRELLRMNTACYTKCHGFQTKRSFLFVLAKLLDLLRRYMSFATKCYGFMTCAPFPFVLAKLRELSRKIHRICSAISRILHGCQVRKFNCVSLKYMIHWWWWWLYNILARMTRLAQSLGNVPLVIRN